MNGAGEKERDRMDVGGARGRVGGGGGGVERVFCSKRYVSIRERRWVIRDLEDCYRGRRFIPAPRSGRKAELLRRLEWESGDRKMNVVEGRR